MWALIHEFLILVFYHSANFLMQALQAEGEEPKIKEPTNSDIMAQRLKQIQQNSRYSTAHVQSKMIFNENNYSLFDTDRVRPVNIDPAAELKDTALAHVYKPPANNASLTRSKGPMEIDLSKSKKILNRQLISTNDIANIVPIETLKNKPDTLEHRVFQHSKNSLPPLESMEEDKGPASIPRPRNAETQKIIDAEGKVARMRSSEDAIAHFAKTPDKADVKLVFCKPTNYMTDNVYQPYLLDIVSKEETDALPVYYIINQNGVMRILNEKAAQKLDYKKIIEELRDRNEIDDTPRTQAGNQNNGGYQGQQKPRKIYIQPQEGEDTPEQYLQTNRQPELMDGMKITKGCAVLGPFMDESTEFVQLDRWILESNTFNILRNFKFFREFYARRAIDKWADFRKYRLFNRNKAKIQLTTFPAKAHFLLQLMNIQKYLVKIRDTQAIDIFANVTYTADGQIQAPAANQAASFKTTPERAWNEAQERLQKYLQEEFDKTMENSTACLTQLTTELKKKASDTVDAEQQTLPLFQRQKLLRTRSITETKAEQILQKKQIETAQQECKQVCQYICLLDQLFNEALLMMCNRSIDQLKNVILAPGSCLGLIQSEIAFKDDAPEPEIVFLPDLSQIEKSIFQRIQDLVDVCNKPQQYQLYNIPGFKEYYLLPREWIRNAQNFGQIIGNDAMYKENINILQQTIIDQKNKLIEDSKSYLELHPLHEFNKTHDEAAYIEAHAQGLTCNVRELLSPEIYAMTLPGAQFDPELKAKYEEQLTFARENYGIRPLEKEVNRFREWQVIWSRKPVCFQSGFAQLDARQVISQLQNVSQTGLEVVQKTALHKIDGTKSVTLEKIRTHIKVIQTQPQELEAFSQFINYLQLIDADYETLSCSVQLCDDLINLVTNQNVVQYNVPPVLFSQFGKPQIQDQDLLNQDQRDYPNIQGLGVKVSAGLKSEMEILHQELNMLTFKKAQAENFAREQYNLQIQNIQERLTQINTKYNDLRTAVEKGSSMDHTSDPVNCIKHLRDVIEKVEELNQKGTDLNQHANIINTWYKNLLAKKKINEQLSDVDQLIAKVQETLKQFTSDLQIRLRLWMHMNEWQQFDIHIMQHPWRDNVVYAGKKKKSDDDEDEEEEKADEAKKEDADGAQTETAEGAEDGEKKDDKPLDEQQQIVQRIFNMDAEAAVGYIQECYKESNKLSKQLPENDTVGQYYKQQVVKMRKNIQLIQDLGNPNLQDSHWEEIFTLLETPQYNPHAQFQLQNLIQAQAYNKRQEITDISAKATGEQNLKVNVGKIEKQWLDTKPVNKEHHSKYSNCTVYIIAGTDELYQQLDDSIAALQTMSGSRFIGGIKGMVKQWESDLTNLQEIYDELIKCQQAWLYLESIFAPEDIRRQLPTETAQFEVLDKFFKQVLQQIKDSQSVVDVLKVENVYKTLLEKNADAEVIQKKLEQYLETKRQAFARFYFISNDELLQILSQTTDAASVIPFLRKIFEAIADLTIVDDPVNPKKKVITHMMSPEKEKITFVKPIVPQGGLVEAWLNALEQEMFSTMKVRMKEALLDAPTYGQKRAKWMFEHPAQTILAGGQCLFTDAVEGALMEDVKTGGRSNMENVQKIMINQINELTDLIINSPTPQQRKIITPLIVIEVFSRDICSMLLDPNSESCAINVSDFGWQKQLRTYWVIDKSGEEPTDAAPVDSDFILKNQEVTQDNIHNGDLIFKQTDFVFTSGYEYYGMSQRLVVTPLTAKAYITLTSAISKYYGGSAAGPAGTGKTETCKDLIKTLQVSCLIFNCSDGLDYKSMLKFFCGLAMTGSFSVFDEFNRILVDTLSVISQQILTIQLAVRAHATTFAFDKYEALPINVRVGFFITFNPDYEGRSALPENVKALFRPIAMIVPDYALIAENFLFSEGFKNGKILSKKMTQLYKLSSEQLSQQPHYDFGMRAIKSILYMAGKLKAVASQDDSEDILLIRAMQDSNIPKFMAEDIVLFNGIVQDLFPGVKIPQTDYGVLKQQISNILVDQGLQDNDDFVTKILQSYDTHIIRHGQMFVGESLTGKTVARETLTKAITNLAGTAPVYKPVEEYLLSAKAITMAELYGELNIVTNEWKDGLIAILARKILEIEGKKIFLVFDSHVDPVWIENLNTVLDDSKMFCLTNGERIRLNDDSNVMFETRDLNQASPATVSRCGMVYFSNEFLGNENVFISLTKHNIDMFKKIMALICLEEFGLEYEALKAKCQELLNSNIIYDDDTTETGVSSTMQSNAPILPDQIEPTVIQAISEEMMEMKKPKDPKMGIMQEKLIQANYPKDLHHYQKFELLLFNMTVVLMDRMIAMFSAIVPTLLKEIRGRMQEEAPSLDFQQITSLVAYLGAQLDERIAYSQEKINANKGKKPAADGDAKAGDDDTPLGQFLRQLPTREEIHDRAATNMTPIASLLVDQRFIFAVTWGIGGGLRLQFRQDFNKLLRACADPDRDDITDVQKQTLASLQTNMPPTECTVYDVRVDNNSRYYQKWTDDTKYFGSKTIDMNIFAQGGSIFDIIVPTIQFVKHCNLLQMLVRANKNVYICGQTGTSKTVIVKNVFKRALNTAQVEEGQQVNYALEQSPLNINTQEIPFSAQTKAETVENAIFEKLDRRRKNAFFPVYPRQSHYIFIDDADMPIFDKFGTQLPNELLRQLIFQSGCYDRQKLTFKQVNNIQMILASQNPGAGRNQMNTRFTSKFVMLGCPELEMAEMTSIFGIILQSYFSQKQGYTSAIKKIAYQISYCLTDLYNQIRSEIRATPMKSHYTFNLRDVARVTGGVFSVNPQNVTTASEMMQLLIHESHRVFRDRLIDEDDEKLFDKLLNKSFVKYFGTVISTGEAAAEAPADDADGDYEFDPSKIEVFDTGSMNDEELDGKLRELTGTSISPSEYMYGRWTGNIGAWVDLQNLPPYENLSTDEKKVGAALQEIVGLSFEEQEKEDMGQEIDYTELLNQKEEIMNIPPVLFKEAILHFSRMYRVLTQPAGNMLCIGLSGSGRKTLLKLLAATIEATVEEPTSSRNYGINELIETIKTCFLSSAKQGSKPVILLLNESSLDTGDLFLEQINSILNGVPLPITVWKNEKEQLFELARATLAAQAQAAGTNEVPNLSPAELLDVFYRQARANFHICLFLSPVGENLRKRLRQFPALVNCTTIDWYKTWDNSALIEVANKYLSMIHPSLLNQSKPELIAQVMVKVHKSAQELADIHYARTKVQNYITPPMFMSFMQLFNSVLSKSVGQLKLRQGILSRGVNKLTETQQQVSKMQNDLNALQPVLQQAIKDTNELMQKLEVETVEVNKVREVVKKEEDVAKKKADEVNEAKADADRDLELAKPAYEKAAKALQAFDKSAVAELATFKQPPAAVKLTMEAICVLFQQPKVDWDTALKLIQQSTFVSSVMNYDKDNVSTKVLQQLRKYTKKPDFSPEKVGKASKAAMVLCVWALAIDKYCEMFAIIKPKMELVAELTKQSDEMQAALKIKQDELAKIEAKLKGLEDQFKESEAKKQKLQDDVKQTEIDLGVAKKLIEGLGDEHESWKVQIAKIGQDLYASVGDALLASAIIAYLGPYTSDSRISSIQLWKRTIFTTSSEADLETQIPVSAEFQLDTYQACADPRQIKDWKQKFGLPGDSGSIQSAVIVSQSKRYPFIIDPELQGISWLRRREKENGVQLSGPAGQQLQQSLDNQIPLGNPLIIENANEELDPLLSSALRKELFRRKDGTLMIKVGDSTKEYNSSFKLFVTTRMRQPRFNPEIQAFSQVVNMAVSSKGLEEQLLSLVVQVINPTLETEKDQIISSLADAKEKQSNLQDELLELLAQSQDPLKDEKLIQKLEESKIQNQTIREQISQGEIATKNVDEQRELYRRVAVRGRILYEAIASLSVLDQMYTYSLEFFKNIYQQTLRKVPESGDREAAMIRAITDACFLAVQRGVFERHKPTFAFMIASGIQREAGQIGATFWKLFLGLFDVSKDEEPWIKALNGLSDAQKKQLSQFLEAHQKGSEIRAILEKNVDQMIAMAKSEQTENYIKQNPNCGLDGAFSILSPFENLTLLRILNPTRVLFYLPLYTHAVMKDIIYIQPPTFNLEETFASSNNITPLIFVLSAGSDPMLQLQQFVSEQGMSQKFSTLALGQGQGEIAQKLLDRAVKEGNWVCLQNVHLCESWLPALQKFVEGLQLLGDQLHQDFRLILTSMPSHTFPASVLALSVKVANEPPRSVKQNILSAYSLLSTDQHDSLSECPAFLPHWRRLLFNLGFFYATLLERKRFGAIGYNSNYDFTVPDLTISHQFARQYLIDQYAALGAGTSDFGQLADLVPYIPLNFMIGSIAFGGRISDFLDSRCVSTIMSILLHRGIFEEKYQVCIQNPNYIAPPMNLDLEGVKAYIQESFPNAESPSIFGLHENAELSYQRTESNNIISYITSMAPQSGGDGDEGGGASQTVQEIDAQVLAQLNRMIEKVPALLDTKTVKMAFMIKLADGSEMPSPYASVLRQECERYNKLLSHIKRLFSDCALAVQGMAVMSPELEQVYKGILTNVLPPIIKSKSYPSLKAFSSYFNNLQKRVAFFREWLGMIPESGAQSGVAINDGCYNKDLPHEVLCQLKYFMPDKFWLGAFHFPHGFFTGILQHHARIYSLSIDKLKFETNVLTEAELEKLAAQQIDGVVIQGLKSEGSRWNSDKNVLDEPIYGVVLDQLPAIWFRPVLEQQTKNKYAMPLYTTVNRFGVLSTTGLSTNYVMNMLLNSDRPESWWILRGAATFIQDEE